MSRKYFIALSLILAVSFPVNYGDNLFYPKLPSNQKGYYEINYSQAYFSSAGEYRIYNSFTYTQFLEEELVMSLQKKYISNKLSLGFLYKYFINADFGEIGIGIRNLGVAFADNNTPFGQEYLVYQYYLAPFYLNMGIQRVVGRREDISPLFGGIETKIGESINVFAFCDYGYVGTGLSLLWNEQLNISLTAYGLMNGIEGESKALELTFTLLNFIKSGSSESQQDPAGGVRLTSEALIKLKNQEGQINILKAKMNSMEYIYSEQFQKKLINEIVSQKIVEKEFRENETLLLKTTIKHIQLGLEYYYLHDYEKSYQEYKLANSLYPNMPLIHESLGSIYFTLNKFEDAKREWLLALSLDSKSEDIKTMLQKLNKEHPELFEVSGAKKNEK